MIMLSAADVLLIVLTCLLVAACVAALTLVLLRVLRRRSVRAQLMLVASAGVVAMAASVVAISLEMYISTHDLTVLLAVIAVSSSWASRRPGSWPGRCGRRSIACPHRSTRSAAAA